MVLALRTVVQLHGTTVSSAIDPPQRATIESVVIIEYTDVKVSLNEGDQTQGGNRRWSNYNVNKGTFLFYIFNNAILLNNATILEQPPARARVG